MSRAWGSSWLTPLSRSQWANPASLPGQVRWPRTDTRVHEHVCVSAFQALRTRTWEHPVDRTSHLVKPERTEEGCLPAPWRQATESEEAGRQPRPPRGGQAKEVPPEVVKGNHGLKREESYQGEPEQLSVGPREG